MRTKRDNDEHFLENLRCARHCATYFIDMISFGTHDHSDLSLFAGEGEGVVEPGCEPRQSDSTVHTLNNFSSICQVSSTVPSIQQVLTKCYFPSYLPERYYLKQQKFHRKINDFSWDGSESQSQHWNAPILTVYSSQQSSGRFIIYYRSFWSDTRRVMNRLKRQKCC